MFVRTGGSMTLRNRATGWLHDPGKSQLGKKSVANWIDIRYSFPL